MHFTIFLDPGEIKENIFYLFRVIKNYLLREESGVLSTPKMDEDKVSYTC